MDAFTSLRTLALLGALLTACSSEPSGWPIGCGPHGHLDCTPPVRCMDGRVTGPGGPTVMVCDHLCPSMVVLATCEHGCTMEGAFGDMAHPEALCAPPPAVDGGVDAGRCPSGTQPAYLRHDGGTAADYPCCCPDPPTGPLDPVCDRQCYPWLYEGPDAAVDADVPDGSSG